MQRLAEPYLASTFVLAGVPPLFGTHYVRAREQARCKLLVRAGLAAERAGANLNNPPGR